MRVTCFTYCEWIFFQRAVFQGLSQEALSACIQSLLKASDIILKNKVGTSITLHFYQTLGEKYDCITNEPSFDI